MQSRAGAPQRTSPSRPYGLSFSIEDLKRLHAWADRANLIMTVSLDQVLDGSEFEELVVLSTAGTKRRALTLWNTGTSITIQAPHCRPRLYACLSQALDSVRLNAPRRQAWTLFPRNQPIP